MLPEETLKIIHDALFSDNTEISVEGQSLPIIHHRNGCRMVKYKEIEFIQQNKATPTIYGSRARAGWKITWGMRTAGPWYLIQNGEVLRNL